MNKIKSFHSLNAMSQVGMSLAQWFWKKTYSKMSVHFYCVRGHVTPFEKFHMSSPKMIFHVRPKLIHWLWFSRCLQKDEKFIDRQMDEQIDRLPFWIDYDHVIT